MPIRKSISLPLKIALAVLATLLLVEAILWIGFRQGREPAVHVDYYQDFPGLKPNITYQRNPLGLRTLSMHTSSKPENTIRILCIGASTTDQGTRSRNGQTLFFVPWTICRSSRRASLLNLGFLAISRSTRRVALTSYTPGRRSSKVHVAKSPLSGAHETKMDNLTYPRLRRIPSRMAEGW